MSVQKIIEGVINREGGYVHHEHDRGGPTCYGITESVARMNGYNGEMRHLPRSLALAIYEKKYFIAPGFNLVEEVSPLIAEELTDTGVNMGPDVAATFLQRSLNVLNRSQIDFPDVAVDGHIGPKTVSALRAFMAHRAGDGEHIIMVALNCLQGARYIELAERRQENESFVFGWLKHRVAV